MNTRKTHVDVAALSPVRRPNTRPTSIYWLVDTRPGHGEPFYCGKTVLPLHQRLAVHKYDAVGGNRRVHQRVRECGEHVKIVQMESVPPDGDWVGREKRWIFLLRAHHPDCCNAADGGAGAPGRIVSAETKAKIVAANSGRIQSAETRAKLSAIGTGRKRSRESVEKGAAKMRGRTLTVEQRLAISARAKARFAGPEGERLRQGISQRRKGVVASDETRLKQRAAHLGKKLAPETLAKMSASTVGKKMSAEAVAKSAAARTGQKRTPEQRARMSAAHKGKRWTQAQREAITAGLLAAWARRKEIGKTP